MDTIIYFVEFYIQIIILTFSWNQVMRQRFPMIVQSFIYLFMIIIASILTFHAGQTEIQQTVPKLITGFLFFIVAYKDSMLKKFIMFIVTTIITAVVALSTEALVVKIFSQPITKFSSANSANAAGMIILQDLLLIFCVSSCIIYKIRDKSFRKNISHLIVMVAFTAIHMAFLIVYYSDTSVLDSQKNNIIQFVYQILIITMVLFQYYNTLRSQKLIETEETLKKLEMEKHYTYDYYMLADEKFSEISSLRHDIQNQIQAVEYLTAEGGNYKEAREIINQIQKRLNASRSVQFCENHIINSVLAMKINEPANSDIDTEIILKNCRDLPFDNYDLCSLFVNLFDNAAEACHKISSSDKKFIEVNSCIKNNYFVLKVVNSCNSKIKLSSNKLPISTKSEPNHGYGTKIINSITKKYNGSFSIEQNENVITAVAVLKLNVN